jgi:hypothetical protein
VHTTYSLIIVLALSHIYLLGRRRRGERERERKRERRRHIRTRLNECVRKRRGGPLNLWQRMLGPMMEKPKSTTAQVKSRSISTDSDAVQLNKFVGVARMFATHCSMQ